MGFLDVLGGGNTLYYPGCLTKVVLSEIEANYKTILSRLGVEFIMLGEKELCCGSPPKSQGYDEDVLNLAKKNLALFKAHGVKKIVTSCPTCHSVLDSHKKLTNWDIPVEHMVTYVERGIGKVKWPRYEGLKATYHDPCHMGRYSGMYEQPRKILKSLGLSVIEMNYSRERSICCGGGGGVRANYPEIARAVAEERMEYAQKTKADILVTPCPMCYVCLKEASKEIEVYELSQLLVGMKKENLPKNSKLAKYC
ncbi:MAG: (Fe-S)-binding protein [Candidatus Micrarchaeota archaeon]